MRAWVLTSLAALACGRDPSVVLSFPSQEALDAAQRVHVETHSPGTTGASACTDFAEELGREDVSLGSPTRSAEGSSGIGVRGRSSKTPPAPASPARSASASSSAEGKRSSGFGGRTLVLIGCGRVAKATPALST